MPLELHPELIHMGYAAAQDALCENDDVFNRFADVVSASASAVGSGNRRAALVPAVDFITQATLSTMALPEVGPLLPMEISHRAVLAIRCAQVITRLGISEKFFDVLYQTFPALAPVLSINRIEKIMHDGQALAGLGAAPFQDVRGAAGGGLVYIQQNKIIKQPPATILRHSTLLIPPLARITSPISSSTRMRHVDEYLGIPYIRPNHLTLADTPDPRLCFKQKTVKYLRQLSGNTCPAKDIKPEFLNNTSLLQQSWTEIVDFLMPPGATATLE